MSGINPETIFAVTQVESDFRDDLGNCVSILGTGFFLRSSDGVPAFVTNKHNLHPALKLNDSFGLERVRLLLRRYSTGRVTSETRFFEVDLGTTEVRHHPNADVSLLARPSFAASLGDFGFQTINAQSALANHDFFVAQTALMDPVSFLGFPGSGGSRWWDLTWNTAIARPASIASLPEQTFSNPAVVTADTVLVAGLSFSGSSGSIVILHQKGVSPGDTVDPTFVPATVIGIMSGHWWDAAKGPEMFHHSGLSYFTRATSLWELLGS